MVACDQCAIYYHGDCIRETEDSIANLEENNLLFVCPPDKTPGMTVFAQLQRSNIFSCFKTLPYTLKFLLKFHLKISIFVGIPELPMAAKLSPNGPSCALFAYPVVDKGQDCTSCNPSTGHYLTDLKKYMDILVWKMYQNSASTRNSQRILPKSENSRSR